MQDWPRLEADEGQWTGVHGDPTRRSEWKDHHTIVADFCVALPNHCKQLKPDHNNNTCEAPHATLSQLALLKLHWQSIELPLYACAWYGSAYVP